MALLPLLLLFSLLPLLQDAALLVMVLAAPVVGRWGAELGRDLGLDLGLDLGCNVGVRRGSTGDCWWKVGKRWRSGGGGQSAPWLEVHRRR
jgi:hypothetical protein